jgi:hypothetical protein
MGCVQIGNRSVIFEKIMGRKPVSDPEGISEEKLQEHSEIYAAHKVTREEWESWMRRTYPPGVSHE